MILKPQDVRNVRPVAENLNDPARLETYIREAETLRLVDAIGADLYRWLDENSFEGAGPFQYKDVSISKEQYETLMDGGYYQYCQRTERTEGLRSAIAYIAYARFIVNNPINATALGVRYKDGEFSTRVEDNVLVRNSSEARKIGEAYLSEVVKHLQALGLLSCGITYHDSPRKMYVIGQKKL